jgi:hypothetical protein
MLGIAIEIFYIFLGLNIVIFTAFYKLIKEAINMYKRMNDRNR